MGFLLSSLCFLTISTVNVQIYQIDTFKIQLISICSFQGTFLLVHRPQLVFIKLLSASGDGEIRTLDPLLARQVLSQLSYTPMDAGLPSFEAIPYSFMFCIYFNQPVTSCITLLGNGLKWTRTTDLTLIRRAL